MKTTFSLNIVLFVVTALLLVAFYFVTKENIITLNVPQLVAHAQTEADDFNCTAAMSEADDEEYLVTTCAGFLE